MKCYTRACGQTDKAVALGTFDGVHLGHQTVMEVTQTIALIEGLTPCAMSFLNHPLSVVGNGAPPLLTLPVEKALLAARCGIEEMLLLPFDRALADLPAEDFVERLVVRCRARHIVVGENYSFGAGGAGDVALLSRLSKKMGFVLHVAPKLGVSGMDVSSTNIRRLLLQGDVRRAAALLGRAYTIGGPVVHGRRVGHSLGFPTINIGLPAGKLLPKYGVYFGYARLNGKDYRAMFNLGVKPTVGSDAPTLEAHLIDFDGEAYGEAARVSFVARIRDERKFASREELSERIARDVELARTL
jgi:riboflavin kinase/FMN adenylyltransferase